MRKNDSQITKLNSWTIMVFIELSKGTENGKRNEIGREVSQVLCGHRGLFEN